MRFIWDFIRYVIYLCLLLLLGSGLYAGNTAYNQLFSAPWDKILGMENHRDDLDQVHRAEARYGWEQVVITSKDGTKLRGTYIENDPQSHRAVILLHGLFQNRTMCLGYASIYRNLGYNVLMPDLRGHGESDGTHTDWGVHDIEDMDGWVAFLRSRDPQVQIGFHGISLGAGMSLLYAASPQGHEMKFYVADSSYGNLLELGKEKLYKYTEDDHYVLGMDALNPFFQLALYYHTHKWMSDLDPLSQVAHMDTPVLFLHGSADTLIPPDIAQKLADQCTSKDKQLVLFQGVAHAMEMPEDPEAYTRAVQQFVQRVE